jgi:ribosomal protein S27AE
LPRKKEIPNKPRFQLVTKRAYELLVELDINEFPVDPRKIIEHFPNWFLMGWLQLRADSGHEDPLYIDRDGAEAKTVIQRGASEYLIVYDERIDNPQRIRWTLAHEIGHIVMGHLVEFESTALNRRGLTEREHGVLEVEAHWFAAELLAPKTIIRRFSFNDSPQGISLICDISKEAAEKRLKDITRMDFGYFSTENRIFRNFYNHLSHGGFYQAIHDTASKFCPSSIYPELCKECRICRICGSFVTDERYRFCPVCGEPVPDKDRYSPYRPHSTSILFGDVSHDLQYEIYMLGKQYYAIPTDKEEHPQFCPSCKSHELTASDLACGKCGTTTVNLCVKEMKTLPSECRYCPDCGAETTFKEVYSNLPERLSADNIRIPEELEDYLECDYWPFIVMTMYYWEKAKQLYAVLEDSFALYDCDDMVIFVRSSEEWAVAVREVDTIKKCVTKHGLLPVTNIRVFVAEPVIAEAM